MTLSRPWDIIQHFFLKFLSPRILQYGIAACAGKNGVTIAAVVLDGRIGMREVFRGIPVQNVPLPPKANGF